MPHKRKNPARRRGVLVAGVRNPLNLLFNAYDIGGPENAL